MTQENSAETTKKSNETVCPESSIDSANRRTFIRKAVAMTAAAGIGATLLGKNVLPESSAGSATCIVSCDVQVNDCLVVDNAGQNTGIYSCILGTGHSLSFGGVTCAGCCFPGFTSGEGIASNRFSNCNGNQYGLDFYTRSCKRMSITNCGRVGIGTNTPTSTLEVICTISGNCSTGLAIFGKSRGCGTGVYGCTTSGPGVFGCSSSSCGVHGRSAQGTGVRGSASESGAIPIVAQGAPCQTANLMQFEKSCGSALSVVNKSGWLGIGTTAPKTTLQVNGSLSASVASKSTNYSMTASDFAILASAATGAITITLPNANTAVGMMVLIKKTDSSTNAVKVARAGSDTIEGASSKSLTTRYASLTLISNGTNEWFIQSNAK